MALQFMLAEFHYKLIWHHHQNKLGANYVSSYNHYSFFFNIKLYMSINVIP